MKTKCCIASSSASMELTIFPTSSLSCAHGPCSLIHRLVPRLCRRTLAYLLLHTLPEWKLMMMLHTDSSLIRTVTNAVSGYPRRVHRWNYKLGGDSSVSSCGAARKYRVDDVALSIQVPSRNQRGIFGFAQLASQHPTVALGGEWHRGPAKRRTDSMDRTICSHTHIQVALKGVQLHLVCIVPECWSKLSSIGPLKCFSRK